MSNLRNVLKKKGIELFQTDRIALDTYHNETYQDTPFRFSADRVFETSAPSPFKSLQPYHGASLFRYFLDGSRMPYKIGDIITTDNKFAPVVAGQVSAAICLRDERKVRLHNAQHRNLLLLYDSINDEDFQEIASEFRCPRGVNIEAAKYSFNKMKDDSPTNAAVAVLNKVMQDMEICLLTGIASSTELGNGKMLVIDGSLQFVSQHFNPSIFYHVIGISKSFNPNLSGLLKGNKQIGVLLSHLEYGQRTPVFAYETAKTNYRIGAWYLRIREPSRMKDPLGGIVKVEKMAEANQDSFDSSLIDNISRSILAETCPTCHGTDSRWANHLYPVYLTETYLKSTFMSDMAFTSLF